MTKNLHLRNGLSLLMALMILLFNFNVLTYAEPSDGTQDTTPAITLPSSVGTKDKVTVTVKNGSTATDAWVGLYNAGDNPGDSSSGGVASIWWKYLVNDLNVSNGNGDFQLDFNSIGLKSGNYKFVLFKDGGYTTIATQNFSVTDDNSQTTASAITLSASTVASKDTLTVTIKNGSTAIGTWVGVYGSEDKPGAPSDGGVASKWWRYLGYDSSDPSHSLSLTDGNGQFQLPLDTVNGIKQGETYKLLLFKDSGYNVDASATFLVSAPQAPVFGLEAVEIKTKAGTPPILPTTVTKDNTDGTTTQKNVTWDSINPSLYFKAGSFTIKGTVKDSSENARADVNVIEGDGPLYTFDVLSDTHITSDLNYVHDTNLVNALKDINRLDPNSSNLLIDGDVVDSGLAANWDAYSTIINNNKHPRIDAVLGNHDTWQDNSWVDQVEYTKSKENYIKYTGESNIYYDYWLNGYHYIVLASEKSDGNRAYFSDTQLQWFQKTMAENAENNKPIFVFFHQPLSNTVAGSYPGQMYSGSYQDLEQDGHVRSILANYPQTILFTGHMHWEFGSKNMFYNKSVCTMFNIPSCGYCWTDANAADAISEGYYIDVYKDKILIKGRNFTTGEWATNGQYEIDYAGTASNSAIKVIDNFAASQSTTATLNNITLTADKTSLLIDGKDKAKIALNAVMTDGKAGDLSSAHIQYSSDNPQIASVDDSGTVSPLSKGIVNITARVTINDITQSSTQQFQVDKIKTDATLKDIQVNGELLKDFASDTLEYTALLAPNTTEIPNITAEASNSDATVSIKQASSLKDTATIAVTSQDGSIMKTYVIKFSIDDKATVAQPIFSLDSSKTYFEKQILSISCKTDGAIIRYTTDGTDPDENSSLYTGPITLSDATTVRAIAIKDGFNDSALASGTYIINMATGTEAIKNGDFSNGSTEWHPYNEADSSPSGVIEGQFKTTIGNVGNYPYSIELSQGDFVLHAGSTYRLTFDARSTVNRNIEAVIEENASGYTRYLDKTTAITSDMNTYTYDFTMAVDENVAHLAFDLGKIDDVTLATHDIYIDNVSLREVLETIPAPGFSVIGGTYSSAQNVEISCATKGSTIRYTLDGTDPTASSQLYNGPIAVSSKTTIKAYATKDGLTDSKISGATYRFTTVALPVPNIKAGTYTGPQQVTITSATEGATIRYTTDGTNPTSQSPIYSGPITIGATTTLKMYASKKAHTDSSIVSSYYLIASDTGNSNHNSGSGSNAQQTPPTSVTTQGTSEGSIIDAQTGRTIENVSLQLINEADGTKTVAMNASDALVVQQADGTKSALTDLSKIGFSTPTTKSVSVTIASDGTIQVKGLANSTETTVDITYGLGNGQKVTIGSMTIKVDNNGNVTLTSSLIDPYGIITDATTGKAITGANVTLYYANTARNIANGKTPDTVVSLPGVDGFKPNNNANPQVSDALGEYGYMVFPTSDYYIVATKDGYNKYTSRTISVEQAIVTWNFKMNPVNLTKGVTRLSGQSRVDTALEVAKATYSGNISNVILVTSGNYPDALAGSVLSYKLNAPILLLGNSYADQEKVLAYMKSKMDTKGTVYILGGAGAVNKDIEAKVTASGFNNINRISGADRYETSAAITDVMKITADTPIVLVSGEDYPDALAISSVAAVNQYPILLVNKNKISDSVQKEISSIKPSKIYIIGLQGAVSTAVEDQATKLAGIDKTNIMRIGGINRFETSLEVAKYFNLSGNSACIATGNDFPDALAGSLYSANNASPIILSDKKLSANELTYLQNQKILRATILGGQGAISNDIQQQLVQLLEQ